MYLWKVCKKIVLKNTLKPRDFEDANALLDGPSSDPSMYCSIDEVKSNMDHPCLTRLKKRLLVTCGVFDFFSLLLFRFFFKILFKLFYKRCIILEK